LPKNKNIHLHIEANRLPLYNSIRMCKKFITSDIGLQDDVQKYMRTGLDVP